MYAIWPIAFWNLLTEFYLSMSNHVHWTSFAPYIPAIIKLLVNQYSASFKSSMGAAPNASISGMASPFQYNKVPALLKRWIAATTGGIICISDDLHHEILIAIYFDLWLSLHQFWNKLD